MFDEFRAGRKRQAYDQYYRARQMARAMRSNGIDEATIELIISSSLTREPWTEEVLDLLFHASAQRQREYARMEARWRRREENRRRRQEQSRRRNQEWWDNYNRRAWGYSDPNQGVNDALRFFGFASMPDQEALKRRYRELALKLHPDKGGTHETFVLFQNHKEVLFRRIGL